MKRKFLYVFIIVAITMVFLVLMSSKNKDLEHYEEQDNSYLSDSERWLKFIDESGEYSLLYPADWELEDRSFRDEMIRADISKNGHSGVQIRMMNASTSDLANFSESYIADFMEEMQGYWQGEIREIDRSYASIGVNYGCRSEISMKKGNGEEWLFLEYIWLHNDYALAFQCGTKLEKRSEQVPQIDQIAASLIFLK